MEEAMSGRIGQLRWVWRRLVCVFRGHEFWKEPFGRMTIAYCHRCNWYGGPTGMGVTEDAP